MDVTPGYVAYNNNDTSFMSFAYLKSGFIHLTFRSYENENLLARSASFTIFGFTPKSSEEKSFTVTASNGYSYSYNRTLTEGISLPNGITISEAIGGGITINVQNSKSETTFLPTLSGQFAYGNEQVQWNYDYLQSYGTTTYSMDCYTFLEVFNDGRGYEPYAFEIKTDLQVITQYFKSKTTTYNATYYVPYKSGMII